MAAVQMPTPNGLSREESPLPELDEIVNGNEASDDGDLFGDEDEEQDLQQRHRKLDDADLDSGDDLDRTDRVEQTVEDEEDLYEEKQVRSIDVDLAPVRQPAGDELYMLSMPEFLGLNHRNYDPATYNPPEKPHDGRDPASDPNTRFSAFSTATSTMYWRRDPKQPELLQSNARIIRWSDGSLTLQHASKPAEQFRINTTALRASFDPKTNKVLPLQAGQEYEPKRDSHYYLVAPHEHAPGIDFQTVRPLDASMRIRPSGDLANASISALRRSLLANTTGQRDPLANLNSIRIDTEKARKEAEKAEKDILQSRRKAVNAAEREESKRNRVLGRSGLSRSGYGLSVAGLEGDDGGMPSGRPRQSAKARRKTNRRGEIYSDDEDDTMPRGRTREDEYDREDDFLADSEEEPEVYDDDNSGVGDEDDEDAEGEADDPPAAAAVAAPSQIRREKVGAREGTPKRPISEDEAAGTAEGGASPQARKKRRVIDDDDDE